ncbi:hypothetical protein D3C80_1738770 [compost metagenome]
MVSQALTLCERNAATASTIQPAIIRVPPIGATAPMTGRLRRPIMARARQKISPPEAASQPAIRAVLPPPAQVAQATARTAWTI